MPKISIIIPVYNAKDYLARCLDSAINQTLKDIEIICVNDASTDNSIDILNNYAKKYLNLKVIDCQNNGGESVARNIGLDNAKGEYIGFVDNDDVIDLDFYEKLYNKAIETNADIVKANVKQIDYNGNLSKDFGHLNQKIISTNNKWYFTYEWWSAIYRTSLIKNNNIRLKENLIFGGDCLFLHYALEHCARLEIINNTYYHWIRRENSGESKILSYEKVVSALKVCDEILDNSNKMYAKELIDKESYKILLANCIDVAVNDIFRNDDKKSKKECIKHINTFFAKSSDKELYLNYIKCQYPSLVNFFENNLWNAMYEFMLSLQSQKDFVFKNRAAQIHLKHKVAANA